MLTVPGTAWASGSEPAAAPVAVTAAGPAHVETAPAAGSGTVPPAAATGTVPAIRTAPPRGVQPDSRLRRAAPAWPTVPAAGTRVAQRRAAPPEPDFLFGQPRISIGIRGLLHRARAESDFYDFVNEELFVRRSADDNHENPDHGLLNFNAPGIGFDFGFGVNSRLDVRVGIDYAESLNESELRNFIGEDGLPFTQRTELSQVELRGELAFALAPRGRAIGQYAWIPSRVVPYVGAGLGFVRYDLAQVGEFVDDLGYFEDAFGSNGWGTGRHLFGGADIRVSRQVYLNVEARHVEASGELGEEFAGFEPLDLSGLRIGAGVRFVF
jgi:opacity protein-like surface antigen